MPAMPAPITSSSQARLSSLMAAPPAFTPSDPQRQTEEKCPMPTFGYHGCSLLLSSVFEGDDCVDVGSVTTDRGPAPRAWCPSRVIFRRFSHVSDLSALPQLPSNWCGAAKRRDVPLAEVPAIDSPIERQYSLPSSGEVPKGKLGAEALP